MAAAAAAGSVCLVAEHSDWVGLNILRIHIIFLQWFAILGSGNSAARAMETKDKGRGVSKQARPANIPSKVSKVKHRDLETRRVCKQPENQVMQFLQEAENNNYAQISHVLPTIGFLLMQHFHVTVAQAPQP